MEQSPILALLLLLASPLIHGATPPLPGRALVSPWPLVFNASTTSSASSTALDESDRVTVTSVVTGPGDLITETETFVPTTYSDLLTLVSTITKITTISIKDGSSTTMYPYTYMVGPGGVGWDIPSPKSEVPIMLLPPAFLPGQPSTVQSNFNSSVSTKTTTDIASTVSSLISTVTSIAVNSSSLSSQVSSIGSNNTATSTFGSSSISLNLPSTSSTASSSITTSGLGGSTSDGPSSTIVTSPKPITSGSSPGETRTSSGITFGGGTSTKLPNNGTTSSEITTSSKKSTLDGSTTSNTGLSSSSGLITSTFPAVTSTITLPPTNISAVTLTGSSFSDNTWITTKDEEDHTTIVPVIITGGRGIVIWGVPPIPNVEFDFPHLPKFHLPCIKIFGASVGSCTTNPVSDGPPEGENDPTHQPSDTTTTPTQSSTATSTSECTATSTVSNCEVQCAKTTESNSCLSFTTTCSQTQTGCSVRGTTSTITSSTSACTTCASCLARKEAGDGAPPFQTPPPNPDDDELQKRNHPRNIERRGPKSKVTKLGTCSLTTGSAPSLTRPPWPAITPTMLQPDSSGNMAAKYSTISRYDRATVVGPCGIPTITRLDAAAFIAAPQYTDMAGKPISDNNRASLDHAYEKSWIKDFLEQIVSGTTGGGKLSCNDLNDFFFPKSSLSGTCQQNRLQPIWNSIASNKNLDFIAMSQYVNGDGKGKFFADSKQPLPKLFVGDPKFAITNSANWKWSSGKSAGQTSAHDTLRIFNKEFELVLLGALEMKSDPMLPLIDRTNNRIYDALLQHDAYVANNPSMFSNAANWQTAFGTNGIAGAYKDYMTTVVLPQITEPPGYLTDLWEKVIKAGIMAAENLPDVKTDSNDPNKIGKYYGEWQSFENFANEVDNIYKKSGKYDWEYSFSFQWDVTNKRQVEEDDDGLSCPLQPSGSVTSATSSPSSSKPSQISSSISNTHTPGSQTMPTMSSTQSSTSIRSGTTISPTTNSSASAHSSTTVLSLISSSTGATLSTTRLPLTNSSTRVVSSTTSLPPTAAPAITIGSSTEKVDKCDQGYGTYSIMAKATAPANADTQKFYVPVADQHPKSDWAIGFMNGFVGNPADFDKDNLTDPRTIIESWSVGTAAGGDSVAKGDGGKDMQIKWTSPDHANGTFVELVYVKREQPLGMQEWGIIVQGGKTPCLPDSCDGPPEVISDDNGKVCKKWPCSTQIDCEDSGIITPRADCSVLEDGAIVPLWYDVTIVTNNFINDDGKKLKSEEKGCGAMTAWEKHDINQMSHDGNWTAVNAFTFTLPITIKSGCVERAIASAGGPKDLQCSNGVSDWVFIK